MPGKANTGDVLARLIIVILFSNSICQALYTSLFLTNKPSNLVFLVTIPIVLVFAALLENKITSLISAIVLVLSLIFCTTYVIYLIGAGQAGALFQYINWFIDLANGYPDFSKVVYNNITILLMAFFVTLFVFLFTVKFYNFYLLSVLTLSIFFIQVKFKILNSQLAYILFIFSFLMLYFYQVLKNRNAKKDFRSGSAFKYLIFVIPFCLMIVFISLLLPTRSNRLSWEWLDKRADKIVVQSTKLINERILNRNVSAFDYFSLDATGFGSSDRLGGNIKLDKKHVMNVKSEFSNLYLKGTSKAFYNGQRWYETHNRFTSLMSENGSYHSDIALDYSEFSLGNFIYNGSTPDDEFFKNSTADIEFTNIKTKSLFIPVKSFLLKPKNNLSLFSDNEQMFSSNEILTNKFSYSINYSYLNLNSEKFKTLLRKSQRDFFAVKVKQYLLTEVQNNNSKLSNNDIGQIVISYQAKADNIFSRYTKLPESVTPRTRQLAADITKNLQTDYDKAKAIETYLSQNYPYTLTPGRPPRNQDFVDYFLFDGKKGYCTYYASAMTVLLRCINIPARYVEGYILPPKQEDGVYKVTNRQAHAWVEVYFTGFGWIPFEPTSPFVSNMYSDRSLTANISSDMSDQSYQDYMDLINQYTNNEMSEIDSIDLSDNEQEKDGGITLKAVIIVGIILLAAVLFAFLVLVGVRRIKLHRFIKEMGKSNSKEAVIKLYKYILKVLHIHGLAYKPGETPAEFGERVEKQLDFNGYAMGKTDFIKITNSFVKARYSQTALTTEEKASILEFVSIAQKLTKEKISKNKYILYKYIRGRF